MVQLTLVPAGNASVKVAAVIAPPALFVTVMV
jgi:hypothetical protein